MPLIPMPASREEWLEMRTRYVGASQCAALWGVQANYSLSHWALWQIKAGHAPEPQIDGPRLRWGRELEKVVGLAYAAETNATVTTGRYAIADDCPGMAASLDFEIEADPDGEFTGPGVLETKNTDWLIHKRTWTDGEPPLHILLQLQHQLGCTGYGWGVIAALIGGNDLRFYRYAARPGLIAQIKERIRAFWASVAEDRPPPVDGSDSAATVLRALYPETTDEPLDLTFDNELPDICSRLLDASTRRRDAEKAEAEAKNQLAAKVEGHTRVHAAGYWINVAVTAAKPESTITADMVGNKLPGRKEARRYSVKEETV
jgi:putative phage-type endonuclease